MRTSRYPSVDGGDHSNQADFAAACQAAGPPPIGSSMQMDLAGRTVTPRKLLCADAASTRSLSPGISDPGSDPSLQGDDVVPLSYNRKEKSLGVLCENFLNMYGHQESACISLDEASTRLGVERRRIYDIVNVLESIQIVEKKAKNKYTWHGLANLPRVFRNLKDAYVAEVEAGKEASPPLSPDDLDGEDADAPPRKTASGLPPAGPGDDGLGPGGADCRREKSLGLLSQKFVQQFLTAESEVVSLEDAARTLLGQPLHSSCDNAKVKTKVRRLYDIANILQSLQLIEKIHIGEQGTAHSGAHVSTGPRKPAFRWLGTEAHIRQLEAQSSHARALSYYPAPYLPGGPPPPCGMAPRPHMYEHGPGPGSAGPVYHAPEGPLRPSHLPPGSHAEYLAPHLPHSYSAPGMLHRAGHPAAAYTAGGGMVPGSHPHVGAPGLVRTCSEPSALAYADPAPAPLHPAHSAPTHSAPGPAPGPLSPPHHPHAPPMHPAPVVSGPMSPPHPGHSPGPARQPYSYSQPPQGLTSPPQASRQAQSPQHGQGCPPHSPCPPGSRGAPAEGPAPPSYYSAPPPAGPLSPAARAPQPLAWSDSGAAVAGYGSPRPAHPGSPPAAVPSPHAAYYPTSAPLPASAVPPQAFLTPASSPAPAPPPPAQHYGDVGPPPLAGAGMHAGGPPAGLGPTPAAHEAKPHLGSPIERPLSRGDPHSQVAAQRRVGGPEPGAGTVVARLERSAAEQQQRLQHHHHHHFPPPPAHHQDEAENHPPPGANGPRQVAAPPRGYTAESPAPRGAPAAAAHEDVYTFPPEDSEPTPAPAPARHSPQGPGGRSFSPSALAHAGQRKRALEAAAGAGPATPALGAAPPDGASAAAAARASPAGASPARASPAGASPAGAPPRPPAPEESKYGGNPSKKAKLGGGPAKGRGKRGAGLSIQPPVVGPLGPGHPRGLSPRSPASPSPFGPLSPFTPAADSATQQFLEVAVKVAGTLVKQGISPNASHEEMMSALQSSLPSLVADMGGALPRQDSGTPTAAAAATEAPPAAPHPLPAASHPLPATTSNPYLTPSPAHSAAASGALPPGAAPAQAPSESSTPPKEGLPGAGAAAAVRAEGWHGEAAPHGGSGVSPPGGYARGAGVALSSPSPEALRHSHPHAPSAGSPPRGVSPAPAAQDRVLGSGAHFPRSSTEGPAARGGAEGGPFGVPPGAPSAAAMAPMMQQMMQQMAAMMQNPQSALQLGMDLGMMRAQAAGSVPGMQAVPHGGLGDPGFTGFGVGRPQAPSGPGVPIEINGKSHMYQPFSYVNPDINDMFRHFFESTTTWYWHRFEQGKHAQLPPGGAPAGAAPGSQGAPAVPAPPAHATASAYGHGFPHTPSPPQS